MQSEKIYLYPVWIRLWHAANAILCLLLIASGVSMQFAGPERSLLAFNTAVSLHNISGILLTCFYAVFVIGNLTTGNGKYYRQRLSGFTKELMKQVRYYSYGMFAGEPAPFKISKERKFNPIQKVSYITVMYIFLPVLVLTGWALLFPELIPTRVLFFSGISATSIMHSIIGFFVLLFLVIHIYFCTVGHTATSNFKSMASGYHETHN